MNVVRPISAFSPGRGPWCGFEIDFHGLSQRNREERERMAEQKGIEPGQCGKPAQVMVDGEFYCRHHAGETLLRDHIGPSSGRVGSR